MEERTRRENAGNGEEEGGGERHLTSSPLEGPTAGPENAGPGER